MNSFYCDKNAFVNFYYILAVRRLTILNMPKTFIIKLFIATLFLMSCASTQRQNKCDYFKEGKFKLNSRFDNSYYIITRQDSTQTETNSKTGQATTAKITWTKPSEYVLQYKTQTRNTEDTIIPFLQTRPLKTKIIKTTKDYCIFETHLDSVNLTYVDTLWRLKN